MRVLLYGESNAKGTGAWCYAQAIRDMGHTLIEFNNDYLLESFKTSFLKKALRKINNRHIPSFYRKRHEEAFKEHVSVTKPDIIIILKGLNISAETINKIKLFCPFVVNINHDDFFSLNRNNYTKTLHKAVPSYDYIFVTREANIEEIKRWNKNVELLMFSYLPKLHFCPQLTEEEFQKYTTDALFVGTYEKSRAKYLEEVVRLYPFKLSIYGIGWSKISEKSVLYKSIISNKGIWMEDLPKAIVAAKISLGFLRKENRDLYTQRTFEIPACGGVLLAEDTSVHRAIYQEDSEAVFFDINNPQSLAEKIRFLLENEEKRIDIRNKGKAKLERSGHSYQDRIGQVINKSHIYSRAF